MQRIKRKKLVLEPSLDMLADKERIEEPMDFMEGTPMDYVEGPVPEVRPVLNIEDAIPGLVANINNLPEMTVDEDGGVHIGNIYIPPAPKPALTFETNGPRLIISRIDIENFKSYAVEQILGPYHQSFTSVIGPNGSGKSNVIDAMLFVFGYRSSKIRSKKISELIHTSSQFLNVNFAKVSVHFCEIIDQDSKNYTVVPDSEIVVTRTAYKDNTSFYMVNGVRLQFKQVAQLLRQKGIDLDHNRFLILQGEIEEIALMKPKGATEHETGMLEYLEDIIGTSRFKMPLEKMLIKVDELNDLRKAKLNRVRLVEQEKIDLEPAMRESVRLVNLTNAAMRTRNMLLQKYIYETTKIVEYKNQELLELKDKVEKLDDKQQTVQRTLAEKNAILDAGMQKYNSMRTKKNEVTEKMKNTKRRLDHIQSSITQGKKKKKTSEQSLEEKRRKLVDLELVPERNQKEIEECKKLLDKHKTAIEKLKEEHKTLTVHIRNQTKQLDEKESVLKNKLKEINKELEAAKVQVKIAETKLNTYLSTEVNEMARLEELKQNYEDTTKTLEEKTKSHADHEKSRIELEKELPELQTKLQALREEEMTVNMRVRALGAQFEESVQNMTATNTRNEVLAKIMQQKRSGRIPGIYGRLGDLGSIDSKYDVAISTACSGLENILVDNEQTGQMCIEYLKTINSRSNFLVLDKQDHLKSVYPRKANYPENVPRLFDLVRVKDERVKPAFYYALRDTLVATDIDQATRIAYGSKRYRVVTLKGELIELSGTMSGGGRSVMRGRMSTSVRQDTDPRVMEQQRQDLQAAKDRMIQISEEQRQGATNLSTMQTNFRQTRDRLRIEEEEIKSLRIQITNLTIYIQDQERKAAASKVDPREKATMEATLKTAQEKFQVVAGNAKELENEVQAVQTQISEVTGSTLETVNNRIKDLNALISKVSTELRKLETAANNSIREATKIRVDVTQLETQLTQLDASLESLSNEKRERTLEDKRLQKEIEELDENIKEGSGEFSGLQEEIQKLNRKDTKYRSEKIELNVRVEKKMNEIRDSESKLPTFNNDLRSLTLEDPGVAEIPNLTSPDPLEVYSAEELEAVSIDELRDKWSAQNGRLEGVKPNIQAILDYKEKQSVYLDRVNELDVITKDRNKMRLLHDALKKRRTIDFLSGFNTITSKLKEMYQMITLGGDAELELVDSLDPFTEGITFSVRPPQKSWKNISNISGGERTLSSLALVFALHYYKPTPLYVMDEIDAALDFKNVSIVANYIKERTRNAQFIIISLRYNMFEVSNRLVGIFKTDDYTKCIVVDNNSRLDLPEFAKLHHAIIG